MTTRLIVGRHPLNGAYGIWLSLPGVEATATVDPLNFLVAPNVKNDMVLMVGAAGAGVTVSYPYALNGKPYVYYWPSNSTAVDYYPFPRNAVTRFGETFCTVGTASMSFSDTTGLGLIFNYLVASRELP